MRISDWSSDVCSSDLQVGILEAEPEAAFEVIVAHHLAAEQRVELEVGERLEEDPAPMHGPQPGLAGVGLQGVEHVGPAVAVLAVARGQRRAVLDQPHVHGELRSEEHTSELQSLMRISYAVFCWQNKQTHINTHMT